MLLPGYNTHVSSCFKRNVKLRHLSDRQGKRGKAAASISWACTPKYLGLAAQWLPLHLSGMSLTVLVKEIQCDNLPGMALMLIPVGLRSSVCWLDVHFFWRAFSIYPNPSPSWDISAINILFWPSSPQKPSLFSSVGMTCLGCRLAAAVGARLSKQSRGAAVLSLHPGGPGHLIYSAFPLLRCVEVPVVSQGLWWGQHFGVLRWLRQLHALGSPSLWF